MIPVENLRREAFPWRREDLGRGSHVSLSSKVTRVIGKKSGALVGFEKEREGEELGSGGFYTPGRACSDIVWDCQTLFGWHSLSERIWRTMIFCKKF
jgi:hypothetical protein